MHNPNLPNIRTVLLPTVSKKMWESQCNSHAVTIQRVHVAVDPLLPN